MSEQQGIIVLFYPERAMSIFFNNGKVTNFAPWLCISLSEEKEIQFKRNLNMGKKDKEMLPVPLHMKDLTVLVFLKWNHSLVWRSDTWQMKYD